MTKEKRHREVAFLHPGFGSNPGTLCLTVPGASVPEPVIRYSFLSTMMLITAVCALRMLY